MVVFLLGLVLTPYLGRLSEKTQTLVDVAEGDALKIHKKPTSLLGGLAMGVAMLVGFGVIAFYFNLVTMLAICLSFFAIFFLGFWDDIKWKHISTIRPLTKFFFLLACTFLPSLILYSVGIGIHTMPFAAVAVLAGFIYIFLMVNSVNYQDGMDGLAGGLAFISLLGYLFLAVILANPLVFAVALIALAAVAAFLVFNLPPAKIFMGDSGSYQLGFVMALLAMLFSKPHDWLGLVGLLLIAGLPVIDGVYTNVRRVAAGKSIFLGDRSHFYDRLMQSGLSVKKTLIICYFLQIMLVLTGIIIYA